jgi:hypothetical protein
VTWLRQAPHPRLDRPESEPDLERRRWPRRSQNGHPAEAARSLPVLGPVPERPRAATPARGRLRPDLNPLPLGLVAAGGTELLAGVRLAGKGRRPGGGSREAAAVRMVQAGALVASAGRSGWRVPLISSVIGIRLAGLVGGLAARPRSSATLHEGAVALWLVALLALRHEAARAEAWNAPLAR